MKKAVGLFLFLAIGLVADGFAQKVATVYTNNFEGTVGPEWSKSTVETTPIGARKFLGQFGSETVSLTLTNLPLHWQIQVSFDLFIINSWDGNGNFCCGPDIWELSTGDGNSLLRTTFSNTGGSGNRQSYPGTFPSGDYPGKSGAVEQNVLGFPGVEGAPSSIDAVYHISHTFYSIANSITLQFAAEGLQIIADESWGIDNIKVEVISLPAFIDITMTDLGTVGSGRTSRALNINNNGEIVGYSTNHFSTIQYHAFYWNPIVGMQDLGTGGENESFTCWINENGEVLVCCYSANTKHFFIWSLENGIHDITEELGTLGGKYIDVRDWNENSQIVGVSSTATNEDHAFLWSQITGISDLGTLGGACSSTGGKTQSWATKINEQGYILGESNNALCQHATFLWTPEDGMIDIGTLGDWMTTGYSINELGHIVGGSWYTYQKEHAYFWSKEMGLIDLGTLGGSYSYARDINNHGQVVGYSETSSGEIHAFIWTEEDGMQDLGILGNYNAAYFINDKGQIIGDAMFPDQKDIHSFIWTKESKAHDLGSLGGYTYAADINDNNQIVGYSHYYFNDHYNYAHAILWEFDLIPNQSPVFALIEDRTVVEKQLLVFKLFAADPEGDAFAFSSPLLPLGAQLNPLTGEFQWSPSVGQNGEYTVAFVVEDDQGNASSASLKITVLTAAQQKEEIVDTFEQLPADVFYKPDHAENVCNTVENKLEAILEDINELEYQEALNKLLHDLIPKTDGCIETGTPDKNDWVIDCEAQVIIYNMLMDLVEAIQGMMEGGLGKPNAPIEIAEMPTSLALEQNYPNPFNSETEIRFQLPVPIHVTIIIYNTLGEKIRNLALGKYEAGHYTIRWDGKDNFGNPVASGVYLYQLQAGDFLQVKKMILAR
jgi:probable HAF family extracellular repeat protein